MRCVVAARGSRLSLAQTRGVIEELHRANPDHTFDVMRVSTRGDTDQKPLFRMDRRGVFEKEVNAAVADGRADFAVHSMKDVPNCMELGLELACVPRRADPRDILVYRKGLDPASPPEGWTLGTSSLRRAAQARLAFPGARVVPIRGNVDTRISKVGDTIDAAVLARAGIWRLHLDVPYMVLPPDRFVPSPGQGALAVVARARDHSVVSMLRSIQHGPSRAECDAERALSDVIQSGCRFPVGARAISRNGSIVLHAAAYSGDGDVVTARRSGKDPASVGRAAGRALLDAGAASFALKWRQAIREWK